MILAGRRVEAILFDLDGTLIDSRPGIEASLRAALRDVDLEPDTPIDTSWLSAPLSGLIGSLMPDAGPDEVDLASHAFMRHYDRDGWKSSQPYAGVSGLLKQLARASVRSFVVTNKRRTPTLAILREHKLIDRFVAIYTPDTREPRYAAKLEMGRACIDEHRLVPSTTIVVGDSRDDLDMARGCGTLFGAATWGYGGVATGDPSHGNGSEPDSESVDILLAAPTDLEMLIQRPVGG